TFNRFEGLGPLHALRTLVFRSRTAWLRRFQGPGTVRFPSAARAGSVSRPSSLWRPTKCVWMFGRRPGAPCSDTANTSVPWKESLQDTTRLYSKSGRLSRVSGLVIVLTLPVNEEEGHRPYLSQSAYPAKGTTVGGRTDDPRREHLRPAEHADAAVHPGRPGRPPGSYRRSPGAPPHLQPGHCGPVHETWSTPCR